jgi:hypothetical protein
LDWQLKEETARPKLRTRPLTFIARINTQLGGIRQRLRRPEGIHRNSISNEPSALKSPAIGSTFHSSSSDCDEIIGQIGPVYQDGEKITSLLAWPGVVLRLRPQKLERKNFSWIQRNSIDK